MPRGEIERQSKPTTKFESLCIPSDCIVFIIFCKARASEPRVSARVCTVEHMSGWDTTKRELGQLDSRTFATRRIEKALRRHTHTHTHTDVRAHPPTAQPHVQAMRGWGMAWKHCDMHCPRIEDACKNQYHPDMRGVTYHPSRRRRPWSVTVTRHQARHDSWPATCYHVSCLSRAIGYMSVLSCHSDLDSQSEVK